MASSDFSDSDDFISDFRDGKSKRMPTANTQGIGPSTNCTSTNSTSTTWCYDFTTGKISKASDSEGNKTSEMNFEWLEDVPTLGKMVVSTVCTHSYILQYTLFKIK